MSKRSLIYIMVVMTIGLLCGWTALAAADTVPLTLEQCISIAAAKNSDLKIQQERLLQAQQQVNQARGDMLPDIRYEFSRFDRDPAGGTVTSKGSDSKFTLSQPLFYGFRKEKTLALSKAVLQGQELEFKTVLRGLKADVTLAFFTLSQIEGDIADIRGTYDLLQGRLKELTERVRLGKSRESETLMVQSQLAVLRAQEESIEGDRQNALETLSYLLGIKAADIKILDDIQVGKDISPVETYLESAKQRSDIKTLRQEIATQEYRVRIAKGDFWPTVNFDGSWYTSRNGSLNAVDWETLLSLDFPLFQGGITKARVNEETSRLRESREQLAKLTDEIMTEIRKLYKSLLSSITQATLLKDAYEKADKSYRIQLQDYRFGLVNNLDVIQAMTTTLEVKRKYDTAIAQAKANKALLDIAVMQ
ncbi:MAG: TolC family protein [bacterium]|nr:TolC family protein [bacterium]